MFVGQLIGSVIAMFLMTALMDWLIVRRIANDARVRALGAAALAYFVAIFLYAWGNGENGNMDFGNGPIVYGIAAIIVGVATLGLAIKNSSNSKP